MDTATRRNEILRLLKTKDSAIKGIELAELFNVTRQVIVKDLALIKATDENVVSTSEGYLYLKRRDISKRVIYVSHGINDIYDELETIIKYGGVIEDIIVEHPYYGELKASLYLRTLNDLEKFSEAFIKSGAKPLSYLTGGEHMHTIACEDEKGLDLIEEELREKGYIIGD